MTLSLIARVHLAIRSRIFDWRHPVNSFTGVYESFAKATAAAPFIKPLGYQHAKSEDWYKAKMNHAPLEDYPVIFWLREALAESRIILDVGGHVGTSYYGFERLLEYPPDLCWRIWDVPSIVASGRALAKRLGRSNVEFIDTPWDGPPPQIVLSAGALQYIEDPSLATLLEGRGQQVRHVLLNLMPVYDGPDFVTLQNIGSVLCPYRVFNRSALVRSTERAGFELVDEWQKPRPFRISGHPERSFEHYSGFYFRSIA